MTLTKRGDVVLVLFPNTDLRTAKHRPALVVQKDGLGTGLAQTVLAMISSNMSRANIYLASRFLLVRLKAWPPAYALTQLL